jgi:hypothetical protein
VPFSVTQARARKAGLANSKNPDPVRIAEAKRDLEAAKLVAHVAKVVESFPPLTPNKSTT